MVDQVHHRLHRVLDDQHGDAVGAELADRAEDAVEIVVTEPGQRLVEQHQPRMRRQGASQLHQAKFARREAAGDRLGPGAEPDPVERGQRHVARGGIVTRADIGADDDVFEDAHPGKGAHHLKRAADAAAADMARAQPGDRLAGEFGRAAARREKPVDDVEQRRLAGAVRADDAVEPALGDDEVDLVERAQPAKRDADVFQHQEVAAAGGMRAWQRHHRRGGHCLRLWRGRLVAV